MRSWPPRSWRRRAQLRAGSRGTPRLVVRGPGHRDGPAQASESGARFTTSRRPGRSKKPLRRLVVQSVGSATTSGSRRPSAGRRPRRGAAGGRPRWPGGRRAPDPRRGRRTRSAPPRVPRSRPRCAGRPGRSRPRRMVTRSVVSGLAERIAWGPGSHSARPGPARAGSPGSPSGGRVCASPGPAGRGGWRPRRRRRRTAARGSACPRSPSAAGPATAWPSAPRSPARPGRRDRRWRLVEDRRVGRLVGGARILDLAVVSSSPSPSSPSGVSGRGGSRPGCRPPASRPSRRRRGRPAR